MKPVYLIMSLALIAAASACATSGRKDLAATAPLKVIKTDATIPFLNINGRIQNWTVRQDGSVVFETDTKQFYHATLFDVCPNLPFVQRLRFEPGPGGELDKFSSIVVDHRECKLSTLDEVANPYAPAGAPQ